MEEPKAMCAQFLTLPNPGTAFLLDPLASGGILPPADGNPVAGCYAGLNQGPRIIRLGLPKGKAMEKLVFAVCFATRAGIATCG